MKQQHRPRPTPKTDVPTTFKCDTCPAEIESSGFPYKRGWVYLHRNNYQVHNERKQLKRIITVEKHYCSLKCMINHNITTFTKATQ